MMHAPQDTCAETGDEDEDVRKASHTYDDVLELLKGRQARYIAAESSLLLNDYDPQWLVLVHPWTFCNGTGALEGLDLRPTAIKAPVLVCQQWVALVLYTSRCIAPVVSLRCAPLLAAGRGRGNEHAEVREDVASPLSS
jgi:hypothetical protein